MDERPSAKERVRLGDGAPQFPPTSVVKQIQQLNRQWRLHYIQFGQFLGASEVDELLTVTFSRDRWPEVLAVLFFADGWPLLSLSRVFCHGKARSFHKDAFGGDPEDKTFRHHFERGPISTNTLARYITVFPSELTVHEVECVEISDTTSRARPVIKIVGPADIVRPLCTQHAIRRALLQICAFSAQLFSKRNAERTKAVTRAITRSFADHSFHGDTLTRMYWRLLRAAMDLTKSDAGSVYAHDSETRTLKRVAWAGDVKPPPEFALSDRNVIPYVFAKPGLRFFLANNAPQAVELHEETIEYFPAFGDTSFRSVNEIAFQIAGLEAASWRKLGVLNIERLDHGYRKADIDLVDRLLQHFSVEMHGVRLHLPLQKTVREYADRIAEEHLAPSSLSKALKELGTNLLQPLLEYSPCDSVSVRVFDAADMALRRVFLVPDSNGEETGYPIKIPKMISRSSVAYAFAYQRLVYIDSFRAFSGQSGSAEFPGLEDILKIQGRASRSSLSVPIAIGRRVVGTVNFESKRDNILLSHQPLLENHVALVGFFLSILELRRVKWAFGQELELLSSLHALRSQLRDINTLLRSDDLADAIAKIDLGKRLVGTIDATLQDLMFHSKALIPARDSSSVPLLPLLEELIRQLAGATSVPAFEVRNRIDSATMVQGSFRLHVMYALDSLLLNAQRATPGHERIIVEISAPRPGFARLTIRNRTTSELTDTDSEAYLWMPLARGARSCLGGFLARQHLLSIGGDLFFRQYPGRPCGNFISIAEIPIESIRTRHAV